MDSRAQSGLEYLMTYGWALIIILTIVGVLVLITGSPVSSANFSSSDSINLPIKAGSINESDVVELISQNMTGGEISVTGVTLEYPFGGGTLNGTNTGDITPASPVIVPAGDELHFEGIVYAGSGIGTIAIDYADYTSIERQVTVSGSKGIEGTPTPECGDSFCNGTEDASTCPSDCPAICGDTLCTHSENASTCPGDCPDDCGDTFCTGSENFYSC